MNYFKNIVAHSWLPFVVFTVLVVLGVMMPKLFVLSLIVTGVAMGIISFVSLSLLGKFILDKIKEGTE